MKEIVVDISPEGDVQVQTIGFKGKSCLEESQFLKDLLGSETSRYLTPVYFQEDKEKVKKFLPLCG
jgi:hypothetical protein